MCIIYCMGGCYKSLATLSLFISKRTILIFENSGNLIRKMNTEYLLFCHCFDSFCYYGVTSEHLCSVYTPFSSVNNWKIVINCCGHSLLLTFTFYRIWSWTLFSITLLTYLRANLHSVRRIFKMAPTIDIFYGHFEKAGRARPHKSKGMIGAFCDL